MSAACERSHSLSSRKGRRRGVETEPQSDHGGGAPLVSKESRQPGPAEGLAAVLHLVPSFVRAGEV